MSVSRVAAGDRTRRRRARLDVERAERRGHAAVSVEGGDRAAGSGRSRAAAAISRSSSSGVADGDAEAVGERMAVAERPRDEAAAPSARARPPRRAPAVPRSSSRKLVTRRLRPPAGGLERRRRAAAAPRSTRSTFASHARLVAERRGRRPWPRSSLIEPGGPVRARSARSVSRVARSRSRPAGPRARRPCDAVRTTTTFGWRVAQRRSRDRR